MNTILLTFSSNDDTCINNISKKIENLIPIWARINDKTYIISTEKTASDVRDMVRMAINSNKDTIFTVKINGENWAGFLPEELNAFLKKFI